MINGLTMTISKKDLRYFSGGDKNIVGFPKKTIHTNLGFAKKCGLSDVVASGAMFEGILAEMIGEINGEEWFSNGRMKIKFIYAVTVGDIITLCVDKNNIWCENQDGIKTCVGQIL